MHRISTCLRDAAHLLAQAGGGSHYGGGGGGGGGGLGGGGGGSGDGELFVWLIYFTLRYPHFGIPLIAGVCFVLYQLKQVESNSRVTRTIRRGRRVQEDALRQEALQAIHQRDPQFTQDLFLERVRAAFLTTQRAWSDQDLRSCRAFISDGVHERFDLYIRMQRAEDLRNRMKDVHVAFCDIVCVTSDTHFDTIHVRVRATAISYEESLSTGRRVGSRSDRIPITFTEIWSFSRRPGVATNPEASVLEGRCPNCGGPVEIVDRATCPQCQASVNSGKHDWVLAEITQDEEWVLPPARNRVAGWHEIARRDPDLNFQHLEDRASVIFWRAQMAVYFEDERYASPVLHESLSAVPLLWNTGGGHFWKTPAVGVVEVTDCEPATNDDGLDRVRVLVRWSATPAEGDRQRPRLRGHQRIYSHVMVLCRRRGATSSADQTFSSNHCRNCGAPIDIGQEPTCRFCATPLNDGRLDWVLEDVRRYDPLAAWQSEERDEAALAARGGIDRLESDRLLNEPELLAALSKVLAVDGELRPKERNYLSRLATRRGVSRERLEQIWSAATSLDSEIALPQDRQQSAVFMDHLIRAALIDGDLSRSERTLLMRAASPLGWTRADFHHAVSRSRRELYQQARQILKRSRRRN